MTPAGRMLAEHEGFPWGWFHVAWSDSLPRGSRRAVRMLGRELVLWRGHDGTPGLLDAHCPHLGAHLGDGRVVDGTIECPFHRWRFDAAGVCVAVPYAARLPRARTRCYPLREWDGMLLAWHHPHGATPSIDLPSGAPDADRWSSWHRRSIDVRAPIFDMAENPVDIGHFFAVHRYVAPPELDWHCDGPISRFEQRQKFRFFGVPVPVCARATSYGPGLSLVRIEQVIDMLVLLNPVPVDRGLTRLHFSVKVKRQRPLTSAAARFASWQLDREFRVDQRIWERKVYLNHPFLCDGDGPIMKFRRWYRQFYERGPVAPVDGAS